jgi:adenylate cyclase
MDVIRVKGKSNAVKVYEVYGFAEDIIENVDYYFLYDRGFNFYLTREFEKAKNHFNDALIIKPNDYASGEMILRIEQLEKQKLDDLWDGSYTLSEK